MPWLTLVWSWLLRLIGGWLPLGNKPIGEWLGKILWAVGIVFICLIVWNKFTKPTTTARTQSGDIYTINAPRFGCMRITVIPDDKTIGSISK